MPPFDGQAFGDGIVEAVKGYVERETADLRKRIADLERRPTLRYVGVWQSGKSYSPGEVVTDAGSMWHCNSATSSARPGTGNSVWTLCCKRGKDARL